LNGGMLQRLTPETYSAIISRNLSEKI